MSQFPAPIPRPQARVSDTYVRPNPELPNQPVSYAPGFVEGGLMRNDTGAALRRLAGVLTDVGPGLVQSEAERIRGLEEIRLSRMTTDEIREDLKIQARSMERDGTLMAGANPYRLMEIQETLADRMMREEFSNTLAANLDRFSQPDNPEDAAEFALSTYQGNEIPGVFGKQRAAALYSEYSSRWLSQVNQRKNERIVVRNQEDATDDFYSIIDRYTNVPGSYDQEGFVTALKERADAFYALTGSSGREEVMTAFANFIEVESASAAAEGDVEEIERLQGVLATMEEAKALGFGNKFEEEFARLELALDKALDAAEDSDLADRNKSRQAAQDIFNSLYLQHRNEDKPVTGDPEGAFAVELRKRLRDAGLPTSVQDEAVITLPAQINKLASDATRDDPEAVLALGEAILGAESYSEVEAMTEFYPGVSSMTRLRLRDNYARSLTARAVERQIVMRARSNNRLEEQRLFRGFEFVGEQGDRFDGAGTIMKEANAMIEKSGLDLASQGATEEEVTALHSERVEAFQKIIRVEDTELGPRTILDTAKMEELGFSPAAIEEAITLNSVNAQRTTIGAPTDVAGPEDLQLEQAPLFDVFYRDFIRYADNISGDRSGPNLESMAETGRLIRADAQDHKSSDRFEVRADGVYGLRYGTRLNESAAPYLGVGAQSAYLMAVRLAGLTPEELASGKTEEGLLLATDRALTDPGLTVMANPDTFIDELEKVAAVNTEEMTQSDLLERLADTDLAKSYLAYQKNQKNTGVAFSDFILAQIQIMPYAGAPASTDLITKLVNPSSGINPDARPVGQETP